jgi:hypothetical protein
VRPPKTPAKGVWRSKEAARCQSTVPASAGTTADRKARAAEAQAIGTARRVTHLTPHKLTAVKMTTIAEASSDTGMNGRYQWCSAAADSSAVRPQVGIQPTSSRRP